MTEPDDATPKRAAAAAATGIAHPTAAPSNAAPPTGAPPTATTPSTPGASPSTTATATAPTAPYVGPDRRHRPTLDGSRPFALRVLAIAVGAAVAWGAVTWFQHLQEQASVATMVTLAHALTGGLLLTSAGLCYAAWSVTGLARLAWGAAALMLAGFATPVIGIVSGAVGPPSATHGTAALARSLIAVCIIALGAAALASPSVIARLRPLRVAIPCLALCLAAAGLVLRRGPVDHVPPALATTTTAVRWITIIAWLLLAAAFLRVARRRRSAGAGLIGVIATLIGIDVLAPLLISTDATARTSLTAAVELFAAVVIVGLSTTGLWRLHRGTGTQLLSVTGQLHGARHDLAALELDQQRRLHDARNIVFAIAGATDLLAGPTRPGSDDRQRLQHLVTTELNRLGHLLDPEFRSAIHEYSPAAALEPLLAAHRLAGSAITADLVDCRIHGRPEALSNAVSNLLTNARVHAPGAHVWVTARRADGYLRVTVADNGPGIPAHERANVLLPGVRGANARVPGSGLGLASAAQALSDAHGTLRLDDREGGGTMITLTIPLDERHDAGAPTMRYDEGTGRRAADGAVPAPRDGAHR